MIRRTFLILALIAVGALMLFTRTQQMNRGADAARERDAPQPGYFMTDASLVQTGPDGLPMYRMRADRIQQNPETLTVRLRHLELDYRVTQPGAPAQQWTLTARQGDMPQNASRIDLSGNVEIIGQPPGADAPPVRVRTQKLTIDTEANVASTADRIEILWGNRSASAVGLTADLRTHRIQLKSSVHARFTP